MPSGAVAQARDRFDPATRAVIDLVRDRLLQAWDSLDCAKLVEAEDALKIAISKPDGPSAL